MTKFLNRPLSKLEMLAKNIFLLSDKANSLDTYLLKN